MKKFLLMLLLIAIAICLYLYVSKQSGQSIQTTQTSSSKAEQLSASQSGTNRVNLQANHSVTSVPAKPPNTYSEEERLNAISTTNLSQWQAAVKNLKRLGGFTREQHWIMEQTNRHTGLPIMLSKRAQTVQYNATLVGISAKNSSGDIIEIQMQTPNMNIDETKQLGLQLCDMLELDPKDFLAWCDKVGNRWMDMPLYGIKGKDRIGFETLHTYNDEKPWCINFIIEHL